MKSGFCTTDNDLLSDWTEKKLQSTFQSQTCTKKGHGHWCSAAGLIHYSFLNPSETITSEKYAQQIDERHRKLQGTQMALINRIGPILLHNNISLHFPQPTLQKLNKLGYEILCHLPYSSDLTPTNDHFFKHLDNFLKGKCFHNQMLLLLLSSFSRGWLGATP